MQIKSKKSSTSSLPKNHNQPVNPKRDENKEYDLNKISNVISFEIKKEEK